MFQIVFQRIRDGNKSFAILFAIGWVIASTLLLFCFFGHTDSDGSHSGWLMKTRPGWLWLAAPIYLFIAVAAPPYLAFEMLSILLPGKFRISSFDPESDHAKALLTPDWRPVEKHFGVEAPVILKRFYQDRGWLLQTDFDLVPMRCAISGGIHVQFFLPIGSSSVNGFFEGFEQYIGFASDGGAGRYVIDIREADPVVHYHLIGFGGPNRFRSTGLKLSQFLRVRRIRGNG